MQLRRQYNVEAAIDYPSGNWWDACTIGQTDPTCYRLVQRTGGVHCGQAVLWDMEPMASGWGVHAMGVIKFEIDKPLRGGGLGTFLISEAMRQLQANGASMVEVQIEQKNASAMGLFRKLGFEQVDQGCVFRKVVASSR